MERGGGVEGELKRIHLKNAEPHSHYEIFWLYNILRFHVCTVKYFQIPSLPYHFTLLFWECSNAGIHFFWEGIIVLPQNPVVLELRRAHVTFPTLALCCPLVDFVCPILSLVTCMVLMEPEGGKTCSKCPAASSGAPGTHWSPGVLLFCWILWLYNMNRLPAKWRMVVVPELSRGECWRPMWVSRAVDVPPTIVGSLKLLSVHIRGPLINY